MPDSWDRTPPKKDLRQVARNAARVAIDRTLLETVEYAKANHPWQNRSYSLLRSHQQIPAEIDGQTVIGVWGVGEPYGFWLEVGFTVTSEGVAGVTETKVEGYSWLRPAADATYPRLQGYVAKEYRRQSK